MTNQQAHLQIFVVAVVGLGSSLLLNCSARAQEEIWTRQFGTNTLDRGRAVAADGFGGVYIAGRTTGDLGGPNGYPGGNSWDVFVARYDRFGEQVWIRQFGSREADDFYAITANGSDGVFLGGHSHGDMGNPNATEREAYVASYTNTGELTWVRQFAVAEGGMVTGLASDGEGGVFFGGYSTVQASPTIRRDDAFMGHFNSDGEQTWLQLIGSAAITRAWAFAPSTTGGFYIGGHTLDDLGAVGQGYMDAWFARYDEQGVQLWIRQVGTSLVDHTVAIAPDGSDGIYISGYSGDSLAGPNVGIYDAFVAHYDGEGNQSWIRQWGTPVSDYPYGLAPDGRDGVYFGGTAHAAFHNGFGPNIFVGHYDRQGNQTWVHRFGEGGDERAWGLAQDDAGGVYIGGYTDGLLGIQNFGRHDAFIARFGDLGCYQADCDQSTGPGVLDMFDYLCFQDGFVNASPYACDCDTSTGPAVCDVFDFLCFQNAFVSGCP